MSWGRKAPVFKERQEVFGKRSSVAEADKWRCISYIHEEKQQLLLHLK